MYRIGIDPGYTNLGLVILNKDDSIALCRKLTPSSLQDIPYVVKDILSIVQPFLSETTSVGIEKYVVYGKGVPSSSAIYTTMLVGALHYMFFDQGKDVGLYRAIDWKKRVCKHLFKEKGFKNPSTSFDKKFSLAAAKCICSFDFKTDHEADAAGIAFNSGLGK